jgi:hypothetical protein
MSLGYHSNRLATICVASSTRALAASSGSSAGPCTTGSRERWGSRLRNHIIMCSATSSARTRPSRSSQLLTTSPTWDILVLSESKSRSTVPTSGARCPVQMGLKTRGAKAASVWSKKFHTLWASPARDVWRSSSLFWATASSYICCSWPTGPASTASLRAKTLSRASSRAFRSISRVASQWSRVDLRVARPSSSRLSVRSSSSSYSSSTTSSPSTVWTRSLMARTCTVRSSSFLIVVLAQALTEAYSSCASLRACYVSASRWLMAANCWFCSSSLVPRCYCRACVIALSETVLLLSRDAHSWRH